MLDRSGRLLLSVCFLGACLLCICVCVCARDCAMCALRALCARMLVCSVVVVVVVVVMVSISRRRKLVIQMRGSLFIAPSAFSSFPPHLTS